MVKEATGLPIITDVHESSQCAEVAQVADILQIPAFLCRQTDLILAAARTGKVLHIKKGQMCGPSVMRNSADKARLAGALSLQLSQQVGIVVYTAIVGLGGSSARGRMAF